MKNLLLIIISAIIIIIIIILAIIFLSNGNEKEESSLPTNEKLVVKLNRKINEIYLYNQTSFNYINISSLNSSNSSQQIIYTDFLFNIYNIEENNQTKETIYYTNLIISNLSILKDEKLNSISGINIYDIDIDDVDNNDKNFDSDSDTLFDLNEYYLKFPNSNTCETNVNNLTEDDVNKIYEECITKNLEIPVTTFSFFENGTLNDLYQPNKISDFIWGIMLNGIKQFVPMLSYSLYNKKTLRHLNGSEILSGMSSDSPYEKVDRNYKYNDTNVNLIENTSNCGGIENLEISESEMNTSSETIVNKLTGQITEINIINSNIFKNTNETLDDIETDSESPFNDIDKNEGTNLLSSGLNSIESYTESSMKLFSVNSDINTTEKIISLIENLNLTKIPKNNFNNSNTLRILINLPAKPNVIKKEKKIPNKIDFYRLLQEPKNFFKPIELSYSIFKFNLIGVKMSLSTVIKLNISEDRIETSVTLRVGMIELTLFTDYRICNLKEPMIKTLKVIEQLVYNLTYIKENLFYNLNNDWINNFYTEAKNLIDKLDNMFDLSIIFDDSIGALNEKIENLISENVNKNLSEKEVYVIQNNITNSINITLKSIDNIDKKVSDKLNESTYYNLVNTNNSINNLLNNINNYVRNNIDNLYNYLINIIYRRNLLTTKDSKQNELRTLQTIDVKEITETVNDLVNELNTIKTLFTQTTSTLKNSVSKFEIKLSNELTQIKNPINKLLNILKSLRIVTYSKDSETVKFIIDKENLTQIDNFLSEKVDSITTIVNSYIKQVKRCTNDIIFFSSDYSFELINNLTSFTRENVPNIYKQILITILKSVITQNIKLEKDFPPKVFLKVAVVLYGVPLKFEINLTYGYFFGFILSINENELTIVLDNYAGGHATINAKAYLDLFISEFGGYIKGLLGEGIVGIRPYFRLYDLKTNLIGYVQLKAFKFSLGVYTKIPWITFKKLCIKIRILFIKIKICIWIPIITKKTVLLGLDIYKGIKKYKSWNLLY